MTGQIESIEWWKRPSSSRLIHHGRLIRPFSSPLQQMTHPRLPKQYLLPIKISPPPALFSPNNHYFLKLIRNYGLITSIWWDDPLPISWRKFVRTRRYQKYSLCKFVCVNSMNLNWTSRVNLLQSRRTARFVLSARSWILNHSIALELLYNFGFESKTIKQNAGPQMWRKVTPVPSAIFLIQRQLAVRRSVT